MTEVLLLVVALLLVLACGAFVAAEFAFVTVDRATIERDAEAGDARARGVQSALQTLSTQLSGAQLGITLTNLLIGFLAEPALARIIDGPLQAAGVPQSAVSGVAIVVALILSTTVTMVLGELVPKNLAIALPVQTARMVEGFMRAFTRVNRPLIAALNAMANAVLRRLGIEPQEELASARSPDELASLVGRSARQGTLELDTATLLQRSLVFGERRAADVMTPRTRVRRLSGSDPVSAVVAATRESGFSRFPVVGRHPDDVIGVVHVKRAAAVPLGRRDAVTVADIMTEAVVVPTGMELDALMDILRDGGLQLAVVVDEFGGVDGIVTLEDVVEEIVGEVRDEHDRRDDRIRREGPGRWTVSGLLRPDEVADAIDVALPESDDYDTLGGLLSERLGRLPVVGDRVAFDTRDAEGARLRATLTVARMDSLRVDRVTLSIAPAGDEDGAR